MTSAIKHHKRQTQTRNKQETRYTIDLKHGYIWSYPTVEPPGRAARLLWAGPDRLAPPPHKRVGGRRKTLLKRVGGRQKVPKLTFGEDTLGNIVFVSLSMSLMMFCALRVAITISISAYLAGMYGGRVACQSALVSFFSAVFWNLEET